MIEIVKIIVINLSPAVKWVEWFDLICKIVLGIPRKLQECANSKKWDNFNTNEMRQRGSVCIVEDC